MTATVLGDILKAEGMHRADAHADQAWRRKADDAIRLLAYLLPPGETFQAADVADIAGEPDHPNAWGSRLKAAAAAGVIEPAGYAKSARPTVHSSIVRTWRGTALYRSAPSDMREEM